MESIRNKMENYSWINKGGCISKATKIINKTAAKLDIKFKQSTTITVWSIQNHKLLLLAIVIMLLQIIPLTTMVAAVPVPETVPNVRQHRNLNVREKLPNNLARDKTDLLLESLDTNRLTNLLLDDSLNSKSIESKIISNNVAHKKKKHRRNSDSDITMFLTSNAPWSNPCGGRYDENIVHNSKKINIQTRKKGLKKLKFSINLANTFSPPPEAIPINDFGDWAHYAENYKYLGVVRAKSNITLVRWHEQMQRYVGTFSYLSKRSQFGGFRGRQKVDNFHVELNHLLNSSIKVLCALETAINSTQIKPKIHRYSYDEMKKFIENLQTNYYRINEIDLKFVKVNYINTTNGMIKALHKKIRELSCIIQNRRHSSRSESANASASSSSSSVFNLNSVSSSAGNSNQEDNLSRIFDLNLSENNSNNNNSGFKRSRFCQRILEKQRKRIKFEKMHKTGVVFG